MFELCPSFWGFLSAPLLLSVHTHEVCFNIAHQVKNKKFKFNFNFKKSSCYYAPLDLCRSEYFLCRAAWVQFPCWNKYFSLVFNKSGNQVKLQIYASECINRSRISFGLILVSDLINSLKAVMNSFSVAASLIRLFKDSYKI